MTTKIYEYINTTPTGAYETATGEICIEPEKGWKYSLLETLKTQKGKPVITWDSKTGEKKIKILKVKSRTEKSTAIYI